MSTVKFSPASEAHIRFDALYPGSYFKIFAEPSRGMYSSKDERLYQKAFNGFYAEEVTSGQGVVLMPNDRVIRYKRG